MLVSRTPMVDTPLPCFRWTSTGGVEIAPFVPLTTFAVTWLPGALRFLECVWADVPVSALTEKLDIPGIGSFVAFAAAARFAGVTDAVVEERLVLTPDDFSPSAACD